MSLNSAVETPSSSDNLSAPMAPPYLSAHAMHAAQAPPSLAPPPFTASLLGATPFSSGLQPPPPLPGALRMPGGAPRMDSPPSGRSTSSSVMDEALALLSYDSAQVGGWVGGAWGGRLHHGSSEVVEALALFSYDSAQVGGWPGGGACRRLVGL